MINPVVEFQAEEKKMILQYIGYAISIVLAITAVLCFSTSFFPALEAIQTLPTQKSTKAHTKYMLLGMLSLFSSTFVFMTTMNGFSLSLLIGLLFCLIMVAVLITIGNIINLDVAEYLRKRNVPSIFSDEYPAWLKNSMIKPASDKDNENKS